MKAEFFKKISLWLPPILWILIIFNFSSGSIPKASPVYWQDFAIKKIGHILLFGILATLIYRGLIGENVERKRSGIISVIISTLYGASDEFHQSFIQGREARIRDIIFDSLGATLFIYIIYNFLQSLPKKVQSVLEQVGIK